MQTKILIVDDEIDIVNLLRDYFEIIGYFVLTAKNGTEALDQAGKEPDIILLDINMPAMDGLEVCKIIRNHVSCPILFLTAKIEDADKINGFRVGGDDYIVKPFSIDELGARVAAHLRRETRNQTKSKVNFAGDLVIDYGERTVSYKHEPLSFAKKEFDIIEFLSMNSGQVFDKERIYECIWSFDGKGDSSVVAEHIRRIRAKLSMVGGMSYIETVWGVGYKWIG
ncbi:DNA-binding response OmpR family regulator [Paenibacillus anaericanus]|uniref:Response regulator transcription factor n=1 Tax=Paenibacillus anaericanus TaxID=170367 RepID=A0A433Y8F9_9BACL|nr:response regulator transcription factor [Paenibacillus anaericanus]MDQ0086933.1 DNA-binding response OmpR family regulator [Paenibacillus anaericanus]RUT46203.1 response regulator transcription factor [Paenibacillus anaericanus]